MATEAAQQLGARPRRLGRRGSPRSRLDAASAEHRRRGRARSNAAPPVLEFDEKGKFVSAWGGPGQGYDWPDSEHGIAVDYKDRVWIGGSAPIGAVAARARRRHAAEVRQRGQVPAPDRRTQHRARATPTPRRVHQSADVFVYQKTQRGVHRRRLRQPPRDRVRRRHRRVQAHVGRVRQCADRRRGRPARRRRGCRGRSRRRRCASRPGSGAPAGARRRREPEALPQRPVDAARPRRSIPKDVAPSSSADPCTRSRSRTTASSTSPTVRTAACRCSRRTAST